MNRRRAILGACGIAVGAALLAGCGVPTTGVVDVGAPATGLPQPPPASALVVVYLVADGHLAAVWRKAPGAADPAAWAMRLLFAGPSPEEARKHLTTHLPRPPGTVEVQVDRSSMTVRLPSGVAAPDGLGMQQVACTAAAFRMPVPTAAPGASGGASGAASGSASRAAQARSRRVTVTGTGWSRDATCTSPSLAAPPAG
ncbi:hypothetical protein [Actinacidiphila guanduensis]|uniref:Sporulation and spore germination n=1 Tax=Actinacidiphila guanduensis TaxID=310781 RepID=A0A1H0RYA1_9ACTN|nr:hypothetical protein [Actinacidiphila guanduensis]SDP33996.1 hypothetical protein SAMN05216259_12446 [Actinacidiphila guanduensis]